AGEARAKREGAEPLLDRTEPLFVAVVAAAHDVEELVLELLRDRADLALADRAVVDLAYGRDLRGGAGEEALVREPELVAGDARLLHLEPHLPREGDDGVARDALEDGRREVRRDEEPLLHDEDVLARALGHEALRVEQDGLVVAAELRLAL